jgi:hypothetical protein
MGLGKEFLETRIFAEWVPDGIEPEDVGSVITLHQRKGFLDFAEGKVGCLKPRKNSEL